MKFLQKYPYLILALCSGSLAALYLSNTVLGEPIPFPDNYLRAATVSLANGEFWMGDRPFVVILFYKLCGANAPRIILVQCVASAFCWSLLGLAISMHIRWKALKIVAIVVFAFFSLWWHVAGWHRALLTESFSMSLFALWLAALLFFEKQPKRFFAPLAVVSFFFMFGREAWTWFGLMAGLLMMAKGLWLERLPNPKHRCLMAGLMIILFLAASFVSQKAGRHHFSMLNVITKRILNHPNYITWFKQQGAPLDLLETDERSWRGEMATAHQGALLKDPRFKPFHYWVRDHGRGVYARFLITHPGYVFSKAWADRSEIFVWNIRGYYKNRPKSTLIDWADAFFKPNRFALHGLVWLICALLAFKRHAALTPLILAFCILANGLLTYHGDAMEVKRHCVMVALVYNSAFLLAALQGLDIIGDWVSKKRKKETVS